MAKKTETPVPEVDMLPDLIDDAVALRIYYQTTAAAAVLATLLAKVLSAERDKLLARIDELAKIQPIQPNEDNQDGKED